MIPPQVIRHCCAITPKGFTVANFMYRRHEVQGYCAIDLANAQYLTTPVVSNNLVSLVLMHHHSNVVETSATIVLYVNYKVATHEHGQAIIC